MKRFICTYFDSNFLPRGLALYNSIKQNAKDFKIFILALDDECYEYLTNLNYAEIEIISLNEFNNFFNNNQKDKFANQKEFYFSITPSLCIYTLSKYSYIDLLLYLDADVYLFNNIEFLYNEIGDSSIAMCTHRLPSYVKIVSKNYGIYNVGINAFRNDDEGNKCLQEWYKNCIEWTPNQENYKLDFFSDQIWLDDWPSLYNSIKIIDNIGINVAPWNAQRYKFSKKNGAYFVDDAVLVVYHFSSLKRISLNQWHGNTSFTILNISKTLLEIYKEYIYCVMNYEYKSCHPVELKFSGSKIKMLIYKLLKNVHNHEINV